MKRTKNQGCISFLTAKRNKAVQGASIISSISFKHDYLHFTNDGAKLDPLFLLCNSLPPETGKLEPEAGRRVV